MKTKLENNSIITNTDKKNLIVIMDKTDYNNKGNTFFTTSLIWTKIQLIAIIK